MQLTLHLRGDWARFDSRLVLKTLGLSYRCDSGDFTMRLLYVTAGQGRGLPCTAVTWTRACPCI